MNASNEIGSTSNEIGVDGSLNRSTSNEIGVVSGLKNQKSETETFITLVRGDLFTAPPGWCLGHCVSRDLHMNKGIARTFRQRFGRVGDLVAQQCGIGSVAFIENVVSRTTTTPTSVLTPIPAIFYLITKEKYWGKPTYATFRASLEELCKIMISKGLTKLAIPRIGCGLDRLNWSRVSSILEEVFKGSGVSIRVYSL